MRMAVAVHMLDDDDGCSLCTCSIDDDEDGWSLCKSSMNSSVYFSSLCCS